MSSFEGSTSQIRVDEVNEEKLETILENYPDDSTTAVSVSDLSQSVSTANEKPLKHRMKLDISSEELVKIFKCVDGNEEPNGGSENSFEQKILSALALNECDVVPSDLDQSSSEGSQKSIFDSLSTIDKLTSNRTHKRRPSITARVCTYEGCETYHYCDGDHCYKHTKEGDDDDRVEIASSADIPTTTATAADQQPVDKLKELRQTLEEDIFFAGPYLDIEGKRVRTGMVQSLKASILRDRVLARRDEYDSAKVACMLSEATEALTKDVNAGLVNTSTISNCELGQLYQQFQRLDIDSDGVITVADLRVLIGRVDPQFGRVAKPDHITEKCVQMIVDTVPHKLDCAGITFVDYILGLQKLRQREIDSNIPSKLLIQSAFWDLRTCILHTPDDDDRGKLSGWLLKRGYALVPEKLNAWKRRYFTTRRCPRNGLILEYFESWDESAVYSDMPRFGYGRPTLVDTAVRTEDVANGDNTAEATTSNNGCEGVDTNAGVYSGANHTPITASDRESITAEPASSLPVVHSGLNDSAAVGVVAADSWTDAERLTADTDQENNKHKKGSKGEIVVDHRRLTAERITVYQTLHEAATAQPSDALSGDGPQMRVYGNQNTIIPRPLHQGFISLTDIALVDFAPQTQITGNADLTKHNIDCSKQIAFQITVYNGPRYTLSGDQETVIMWVSQLGWYVAASRLMREWRANWGTQRMAKVTLRDWINAAAVITKLGHTMKRFVDHRPAEDEAAADSEEHQQSQQQHVRTPGDCALDPREREMLSVVGLKDDDSVEEARERVLAAIQSHHGNPLVLNHTHKSPSVFLWKYARALKNRYNMKKFHVICDSKATATHCAVCHARFKYLTMRVEYRKYHCRCCGRVVCHACSGRKVFLKHTQTVERVCTECVRNGGPPQHRLRIACSNISSNKSKPTLAVNSPAATSVVDSGGDNIPGVTENNNNNNNGAEVGNKEDEGNEKEEMEESEEVVRARVAEEAERQRVLAEEQRAIRAQEKAAVKAKSREMKERAAALEAKREEARAALRARQEARLGRREEVQDKAAEAKAAREKATAPPIKYNYS